MIDKVTVLNGRIESTRDFSYRKDKDKNYHLHVVPNGYPNKGGHGCDINLCNPTQQDLNKLIVGRRVKVEIVLIEEKDRKAITIPDEKPSERQLGQSK